MKMAKASEADLNRAIKLLHGLDQLSDQWCPSMPDDIAVPEIGEDREPFHPDDSENCIRALDWALKLASSGSLSRVIMGAAVLLDPANKMVDPDANTLEFHPEIIEARKKPAGWQPIETAPFEGQTIIVPTSGEEFFTGRYCTKLGYPRCINKSMRFFAGFECWMPVPEVPA